MSLLSLLLNVLWICCGGLWMAAAWLLASVIMAITIVGIPWARAAFNIAAYTLLPFGQTAVSRADYFGQEDTGTGPLGLLGNLIWLVLAGWWLALAHLITAVLLAITIVGIPFAWAHLKLAGIALWPIGKEIVPADAVPGRLTGRAISLSSLQGTAALTLRLLGRTVHLASTGIGRHADGGHGWNNRRPVDRGDAGVLTTQGLRAAARQAGCRRAVGGYRRDGRRGRCGIRRLGEADRAVLRGRRGGERELSRDGEREHARKGPRGGHHGDCSAIAPEP